VATNGRVRRNYLQSLSVRYYCSACQSRVYPYERIMGIAEIHKDSTGNDVLLYTLNNGIEPGFPKWAYCDHCEKYVQANRVSNHDVIIQRIKRANIMWRLPEGQRRSQQNIEAAIAKHMMESGRAVAPTH
jgi:hypothetical protein